MVKEILKSKEWADFLDKKYGSAKHRAESDLKEFLDKFQDKWKNSTHYLSDNIHDAFYNFKKQACDYSKNIEKYAKNKPLKTLAMAAGLGALITLILK